LRVLPKEVDVSHTHYDTMTDDQLRAQLRAALREAEALGLDLASDDEPVH
jgi:hypothetical protein